MTVDDADAEAGAAGATGASSAPAASAPSAASSTTASAWSTARIGSAAQWQEEQSCLSELEFDWIRQWYVQGAAHRDEHGWWGPRIAKLEALWSPTRARAPYRAPWARGLPCCSSTPQPAKETTHSTYPTGWGGRPRLRWSRPMVGMPCSASLTVTPSAGAVSQRQRDRVRVARAHRQSEHRPPRGVPERSGLFGRRPRVHLCSPANDLRRLALARSDPRSHSRRDPWSAL